jgi:TPR repeat protein
MVDPVPTTDLSFVKIGTTRAEVESVLKRPVNGTNVGDWRLDTYEFDKGRSHARVGVFVLFVPLPIPDYEFTKSRTWYITLAYDRGDIVEKVYSGSKSKKARESLQAALSELELRSRAEQGGADAQWQLAVSGSAVVSPEERGLWQCEAAHQGRPEALWHLALDYWYGISPFSVDHIRAYMWTLIAVNAGAEGAASALEERAKQLTPDQIVEAERLAAEWQRDPTPCEVEVEMAVAGK